MRAALRVLGCAAILSCGGAPDPLLAAQPIVGGTLAGERFPAVVKLALDFGPMGMLVICTGTLVAPNAVLTAGHCTHAGIVGYSSERDLAAAMRVIFDDGPAEVERVVPNPAFRAEEIAAHISRFHHDVGLVFLKSPVTNVTPVPFHRGDLTAHRGQIFTQVGAGSSEFHGFDSSGFPLLDGLGEKRFVEFTLADFDADRIYYGDDARNTCFADSGGPALLKIGGVDTVIAVSSSFVDAPLCHARTSSQRTSAEVAFLDATLALDGGTHADGATPADAGRSSDGGAGVGALRSGGCSAAGASADAWFWAMVPALGVLRLRRRPHRAVV